MLHAAELPKDVSGARAWRMVYGVGHRGHGICRMAVSTTIRMKFARRSAVKKRKTVLIVLEIAAVKKVGPACGSPALEHRSVTCRVCQRIYAQRKRSAARGGLAHRRRYRRKKTPAAALSSPPAIAQGLPCHAAKCGARARDHRARSCPSCRRIWNHAYYIRACARRRALQLPSRTDRILGEAEHCEMCGATQDVRIITEDSDFGAYVMRVCGDHEFQGHKVLADRVAERFAQVRPSSGTIADVHRDAMQHIGDLDPAFVAVLEERAANVLGFTIDKNSPMFRSRFAQLVRIAAGDRK